MDRPSRKATPYPVRLTRATRTVETVTTTNANTAAASTVTFITPTTSSTRVTSALRRVLLTRDLALVLRRVVFAELIRNDCHYWPFSIVCIGTVTEPDIYEIRAPHPILCVPASTSSEYHALRQQRIFDAMRLIAVNYGLGLTWFKH